MRNVHLQEELIFYIFSFDRPMQLDALLSSMHSSFSELPSICVQFKVSTERTRHAYNSLKSTYTNVHFIEEDTFRQTLLFNIQNVVKQRFISFLVDDILFVQSCDLRKIVNSIQENDIFSLRLGLTLSASKIVHKLQSLPNLQKKDSFYSWRWNDEKLDWGYAFSLDGNIFPAEFIVPKIQHSEFKGPNSLEGALSKIKISNSINGLCSGQSILVNLPFNRVQNEVSNWSANLNVDDLINRYFKGDRIDTSSYRNRIVTSVHEDWEIKFAT
jgi:hypothetical protein